MQKGYKSFEKNNIVEYVDYDNKFIEYFNKENGFYMRTGVIENGKDTGVDPFMRNYPQLLDIGIMGSCIHGKTGLCSKSGVQCYQNGLNQQDPDMSLQDFESIMKQCSGRTFQVALGGRGDPNKHANFEDILKTCKQYGVVPNYTTSGLDLTDREIELTKEYCGAVAVSWYRNKYTLSSIDRLLKANIKTNIHYVLGKNSIDEAIEKLKTNGFPKGINAVIFLLHKPVGQGKKENCLDINDPKTEEFYKLVDKMNYEFKIGFDSCNVPAILNICKNIELASIDTCEAARHSAYITSDMKMLPCSFDNQSLNWAIDLKENTVEEAWNSDAFEMFRDAFRKSCGGCSNKINCMGGCPIIRDIVLCNNPSKNLFSDILLKK